MATYLVTPLAHNFDQLGGALRKVDGAEVFELQSRAGYLVEFAGTSVDLTERMGLLGSESKDIGSALVTSVGSYYGRGPTTMWEWLKTKFESR